jgi:alginate O-acetyltransferase complex protein AlgJ
MQRTRRTPGDVVVIAVFALLLLAPALLALTGHAGFDTEFLLHTERRQPFVAPRPTTGALATGGWERDAEREIADAFPLRKQLIQSYDYAKFTWLGDDAPRRAVIRGRDGWLFLGAEERTYLTDPHAASDAELTQLADLYAARAAWCARRNIRYVFLLAPNKSTVYSQELPPDITRVTPTPADRLLPLLHARGIRTIDPRDALVVASRNGDVYSKGDTHWNDAGAYVAYRATVAALRDTGVRDTIRPATIRAHTEQGSGDLLAMSGVADFVHNPWIHYDYPRRAHEIAVAADAGDPALASFARRTMVVNDRSLPVAVVVGDSFSEQLAPFLAESFRHTTVLHHLTNAIQFDRRIVEAEHPSIVIQELVERTIPFSAAAPP